MTDPTTLFFEELEARGHEPRLEKLTATFRFDVMNGKRITRWHVAVKKGDIAVSHKNTRADCIVRVDKTVFDGIASGEVNPVAAVLRGSMGMEGDRELLVLFQRLFPGPPRRSK